MRTREAQAAKQTRAELVAHVGGKPTAAQLVIIEQIAQIRLRLAVMDSSLRRTGEMSDHHCRHYLALANTMGRLVKQLGLKGAAQRPPSIADYIAARTTDGAPAAVAAPGTTTARQTTKRPGGHAEAVP